jgi:hypothetical protein
MSYDLMVFQQDSAPSNKIDFMKWYESQTYWVDSRDYNDPRNTSENLWNLFIEMIRSFLPLNGPYRTEDIDNPNASDYSLGSEIIYVAFSWSVVENARQIMMNLAEIYQVGFLDLNDEPSIYFFDKRIY